MSNLILPPDWKIPDRFITPEPVVQNRRQFLKLMGFTGLSLAELLWSSPAQADPGIWENLFGSKKKLNMDFKPIPGLKRNPEFTLRRDMTLEEVALKYNNFYEFTSAKDGVWQLIDDFKPRPWQVTIGGHVEKPGTYEIDDLIGSMPLEERVYRHRCVETWAMVVPWNGFPMEALLRKVRPTAKAKFVKFTSFDDPAVAPGQKRRNLPWPYNQGLTMDEAENELTFLATGLFGHVLPNQHGAPLRLVVPWKYGYKSIKSIVKIEFTDFRPATFWSTLIPNEYPFESNVDPDVPHPRWSQKREKMIGTGEIFATQKFNGYGPWVADLYS